MIGWTDVYKVIEATVPLYVALLMGYGSVRWWRIFTAEQCDAITRLVCYFTLPLFTFEFTAHVDPFEWNYMFIAADVISKAIIVAVLALWAKFSPKGSYGWSITSFSLSTLTNSLVVGVPLLKAMYGSLGVDLVVQSSVVQAIVWLTILLFVLEFRRAGLDTYSSDDSSSLESGIQVPSSMSTPAKDDLEDIGKAAKTDMIPGTRSFWNLMKVVGVKLAMNPNSYACIIGIVWALIKNRWQLEMPGILEGSVLIMSKAGTGTAMFSMGIFMALQEKIVACGANLTIFGLLLKFVAGPITLAIGAVTVGLHGDVLRIAIIQAALPQSITSFIYAKEYGLHPSVLSTAVIFGMIVSLPVLIAYYAILEFVH
ncbi:hypothetical protein SAY87_016357 [Trapa incisa]|nr:hypothetical protein SAY87_016357 [Trapa incisa]